MTSVLEKQNNIDDNLLKAYKDIRQKIKKYYNNLYEATKNWEKAQKQASPYYYSYIKQEKEI